MSALFRRPARCRVGVLADHFFICLAEGLAGRGDEIARAVAAIDVGIVDTRQLSRLVLFECPGEAKEFAPHARNHFVAG